jgi:hypothetical protein
MMPEYLTVWASNTEELDKRVNAKFAENPNWEFAGSQYAIVKADGNTWYYQPMVLPSQER